MKDILFGQIPVFQIEEVKSNCHTLRVAVQRLREKPNLVSLKGVLFKTERTYYVRFVYNDTVITVELGNNFNFVVSEKTRDAICFCIDLSKGKENSKFTKNYSCSESKLYTDNTGVKSFGPPSCKEIAFDIHSFFDKDLINAKIWYTWAEYKKAIKELI